MAETFYWSAGNLSFYLGSLQATYAASGSWPDDAVVVDPAIFLAFGLTPPPPGRVRGAGSDRMPSWIAAP